LSCSIISENSSVAERQISSLCQVRLKGYTTGVQVRSLVLALAGRKLVGYPQTVNLIKPRRQSLARIWSYCLGRMAKVIYYHECTRGFDSLSTGQWLCPFLPNHLSKQISEHHSNRSASRPDKQLADPQSSPLDLGRRYRVTRLKTFPLGNASGFKSRPPRKG
jgi:hypothetical protein